MPQTDIIDFKLILLTPSLRREIPKNTVDLANKTQVKGKLV